GLTILPHEIDEWDTNGTSRVWVRVPELSGPEDFIWAYWGNPLDIQPPPSATNGAVWLPETALVWHLKESGFPFADSTAMHPALSGVAPLSTSGEIGRAVSFNGTSQFLNAGAVNLGDAFTLSSWVKLDAGATDIQPIWANKGGGWNANGFALFVNSYQTTDRMLRLETGDGVNGSAAVTATGAVSLGQWHLITATVDRSAGSARLYIDGTDRTQNGPAATDFANTGMLALGEVTNGSYHIDGVIDEARVENGTRSADWIRASWMTVSSNTDFQEYSAAIPQLPVLSAQPRGNGELSVSWPASAVGFTLFTTTNLTPPVVWQPGTNQPIFTNNQWQATLPVSESGERFYRLQFQ
ncbi:MAG TPA: LamG-like jellyroll fold domain-containing protein, partial [Verrucomicrobiae bacterium]|nr:LamG-like jellyroll fold domain-containing protein [Verrucomicrobiae bacterium]